MEIELEKKVVLIGDGEEVYIGFWKLVDLEIHAEEMGRWFWAQKSAIIGQWNLRLRAGFGRRSKLAGPYVESYD